MGRKFIVGGNFKANGTKESLTKLIKEFNAAEIPGKDVVEVVVAPPFVYIPLVKDIIRPDIEVAAQNAWVKAPGAYTGEVPVEILKDIGLSWVILGHSERRAILGESSEFIADKTKYAIDNGLKVILCIGEQLDEREKGETLEVVAAQLKPVIAKLSEDDWKSVVLAYEPVWAIGTGKVATPEQAEETQAATRAFIRDNVSPAVADALRIQYGGSVNAKNCVELASQPDIDGFLVGGASLKPEFIDIIKSATAKK